MHIAVIGTGTMGAGIAYVAAAGGQDVSVFDFAPAAQEAGLGRIAKDLDDGVRRGKLDVAQRETALSRVRPTSDLADCVAGADLVIEAIIEDPDIKQERRAPKFAALDGKDFR